MWSHYRKNIKESQVNFTLNQYLFVLLTKLYKYGIFAHSKLRIDMTHRLIKKIDVEQKKLEISALSAACQALGFSDESRKDVARHYEWLLTLQLIQKEIEPTDRMIKQLVHAKRNYIMSLERAISKAPLKVADWTRAGRAMQRVFKEAYTKTR